MKYNDEFNKSIENYCLNMPGAYETRPFGKYPICYKVMGKIFAQFYPEENFYKMTLKCEPSKAQLYRDLYQSAVVRGYYCPPIQQPYWNTVDLDAFTDTQMLYQMIDEAYEAVIKKFSKKVKNQLLNLCSLEFKDTDGEDKDFVLLCDKLDQALDEIVGGHFERCQYEQYNKRDTIHDVIVVYQDTIPIACGAFKMYDEEHAELKRLFTAESCRNLGLGKEILRRLEAKAKIKGYKYCILETGQPLEAACHIYQKAGYEIIPNYGQYACMSDSICMQRKI